MCVPEGLSALGATAAAVLEEAGPVARVGYCSGATFAAAVEVAAVVEAAEAVAEVVGEVAVVEAGVVEEEEKIHPLIRQAQSTG